MTIQLKLDSGDIGRTNFVVNGECKESVKLETISCPSCGNDAELAVHFYYGGSLEANCTHCSKSLYVDYRKVKMGLYLQIEGVENAVVSAG